MAKHHPANERIKRQYLIFLQDAQGKAESTIDQIFAAISAFEHTTKHKDFKSFHIEQARAFKRYLFDQLNPNTGKPLALSTIHSRLMALKAFFKWLAGQPGYKSRIQYSDAEYFNSTGNNERIAKAARIRPVPTMDQIRKVLATIPTETAIDRRNRALIAFAILSRARDNAIASFQIGHVDVMKREIDQDARYVRTKARKSFVSWFFPVGDDIETIVVDWIEELKVIHLSGPSAPLFPSTKIERNKDGFFAPVGFTRRNWSNAGPIRKIFKDAFEGAGLPYFNPHSFRKTLVTLGELMCQTPEEFKAWSQNLSHEQVLTTFMSYGEVPHNRQAELFEKMRKGRQTSSTELSAHEVQELAKLVKKLQGTE